MEATEGAVEEKKVSESPEALRLEMEQNGLPEGWKIRSITDLNWALSRIVDCEQEIRENNQVMEEAVALAKFKTALLNEALTKSAAFFRDQAVHYAEEHKAELIKGKTKTRKLLHGSVSWKTQPAALVMTDAAALLVWAEAQPVELEYVRVKRTPAWDAIKKAFSKTETGEIPPGTDLSPEVETLTIKTEAGGSNAN